MRRIGIVLFEGAEELDVVGPYEVLAWAARVREGFASVFTVAATRDPVRCHKGMRIVPDHDLASAPPLDVIVVPGAVGVRAAARGAALLDHIRAQSARCEWVTSVCRGAAVLLAAGPAAGKRITTYLGAV
jgi:putative intracellular protease/amidase